MITFVPKNHNIPRPQGAIPPPTWYYATRSQSKKTIPQ